MSKSKMTGWGLSGLLGAFLIVGSASGKFLEWEGKAEMFGHLGYSSEIMFGIGVVEVVISILFLIPKTSFCGAILLTGYLGGAVTTHLRVGDPYVMPIVLGVVMWVALGLRDRRVFAVAFGSPMADRREGEIG